MNSCSVHYVRRMMLFPMTLHDSKLFKSPPIFYCLHRLISLLFIVGGDGDFKFGTAYKLQIVLKGV